MGLIRDPWANAYFVRFSHSSNCTCQTELTDLGNILYQWHGSVFLHRLVERAGLDPIGLLSVVARKCNTRASH